MTDDYFATRLDRWALAFYALADMAGKAARAGDGEPMRKLLQACLPAAQLVCDCTDPADILPLRMQIGEATNGN